MSLFGFYFCRCDHNWIARSKGKFGFCGQCEKNGEGAKYRAMWRQDSSAYDSEHKAYMQKMINIAMSKENRPSQGSIEKRSIYWQC